jgi:hypothetical protein
VEQYFDAFLHTSNAGPRRLIFRLPLPQLSLELAQQYCSTTVASARAHEEHLIIELSRFRPTGDAEDAEDADWDETDVGEGWLATLLGARAGVIGGDLRLLYLGWLLSADSGELDDEVLEPPVPADLGDLGEALRGVADFLDLDEDLLDIAAEASPQSPGDMASWIAQLPAAEKDALLLRAARGESAHLQAELQLGLRRFTGAADQPEPAGSRRSVGELLGSMQQRQLDDER